MRINVISSTMKINAGGYTDILILLRIVMIMAPMIMMTTWIKSVHMTAVKPPEKKKKLS